jgi:pilus assembly protein CpaE
VPSTPDWRPAAKEVVELAKRVEGRAFVAYVCDEIGPEDYKALLRTGTADCFDWVHASGEFEDLNARLRGAGSPLAPFIEKDISHHRVVGLLPAGGGVGNTTLALEAGVYFARQKGKDARRTGVVELDFNRSTICDYVDVPPRLDIAELARNPRRLDDYMLDVFRSHHSSGLDLYSTAEPPADSCVVEGMAVFTLLNRLHDRYEILLIDFPDYKPPWGDEALRNCDFVFVTGRNSIPSLKQTAREMRRLRNLGFEQDRVAAFVTHCQGGLFGVTGKAAVETVLAGQRVFYIRDDAGLAIESVNSGASMMEAHRGRGICRDIRAAAAFIQALTPRAAV